MELQTRQEGPVSIVRLMGRLDLGSLRLLEEIMRALLKTGTRAFVLQVVDVTDISSSES